MEHTSTVFGAFRKKITKDQSRDTGMAMVLLLLIGYLTLHRKELIFGAIALHVINMTAPQVFRPVAVIWLGFSELLGAIVSRILLAIIFFVVVTPVAIFRRIVGKDSLRLRAFKSSDASAMIERNHLFVARDLERPY